MRFRNFVALFAGLVLATASATAALASDLPNRKPAPVAPPAPPSWWSTASVSGVIDSGITFNPDLGTGGINFGSLFTDKANEPLLNQIYLTAQRPIDPNAKTVDFGFKVEVLYGSDARYTHFLGECDYCIGNINQFDVVEAWGEVHLPYVFSGGIDVKAGQFVTLLGSEVINGPDNIFYSHSYIFNYGLPFKDTGVMTIYHVTPMVDLYAGAVTGLNTSLGWASPAFGDPGDNNSAPGFEGGIGLNLLGGDLTILAATNIGPGNANTPLGIAGCGCNPNSTWRYLNDVVVTWKATKKLTLIGEGNYAREDGWGGAEAYGVAGYATYQLLDWMKVSGRAEIYRDNNNFFVAAFPGNFDFVNAEHGYANGAIGGPAPTTYFELTGGVEITPTLPKDLPYLKQVMFRPEIRYDSSLNGTTPYDLVGGAGTKNSAVTFAGDVSLKF